MDKNQWHAVISSQYFLAELDSAQRARLVERMTERRLSAGEHLFQQADNAREFYIVVSGRIKLYRVSAEGGERVMGVAEPEQSFAEGILFMEPPRYPVNAQALAATTVVGINRATFRSILNESTATCLALMARMTGRIQNLLNEIESLTLQNSRQRLIHFLLGLEVEKANGTHHIRLPMSKSEIAARLSIKPETLSRLLRLLADENLIQAHNKTIEIRDRQALYTALESG